MTTNATNNLATVIVLLFATAACQGQHTSSTAHSHSHHAHEQGHATEGPHHGSLIELGAEEYHAELIHDESSGIVMIYILDATAEIAVPIAATELMINLKRDGKAQQFALTATPGAGDPAGMSSCFTSSALQLGEGLDREDMDAKLVVKIKGKSFRGRIEHRHQHGHDHDHNH